MDWSFLNYKNFKLFFLIQNITVAVLLQIAEELIGSYFHCVCSEYMDYFISLYFAVPANAFIVVALSLQQDSNFLKKGFRKYCCKGLENIGKNTNATATKHKFFLSCLWTVYPAFCWVVILLIDGRYLACALYRTCDSPESTWTVDDSSKLISKIWGLGVVGGFVTFYFLYQCWYCCCRSTAAQFEEMCVTQLVKDSEEFAGKYARTISKNRAALCKQNLHREAELSFGAVSGGGLGLNELKTIGGIIDKAFDLSVRLNVECENQLKI